MRTALVGHRGAGKTSLLERIQTYYSEQGRAAVCLDLDQEIEAFCGKSITELFQSGEPAFRDVERQVFAMIETRTADSSSDVYLACGGGFSPSEIPSSWRVVWIRRPTDSAGRVFLDRPRLDAGVAPIDEFLSRAENRAKSFAARADEVLWIDEGIETTDFGERVFFTGEAKQIEGAITLLPSQLESRGFKAWLTKRLNLGVRWIELRDDLLSIDQIKAALNELPDEKVLLSFRDWSHEPETSEHIEKTGVAFDWPIEWGECRHGDPAVLSLHERDPSKSLMENLAQFDAFDASDAICKAALPIETFEDLKVGHAWFSENPSKRVFLPMSKDGRWTWYRLLISSTQSFGFMRDSDGTSTDQPSLLQWIRRRRVSGKHFAALIGDPVTHSRSPVEHCEYFAKKNASMFAIRVSENEFTTAMPFLTELGLRWVSVTAPLKSNAFELSKVCTDDALRLKSVNTLILKDGVWHGANTDLPGLKETVQPEAANLGEIAVWGGGGTLAMVNEVFLDAQLYSMRTGENRKLKGIPASHFLPKTVVWAVGRSRTTQMPPISWIPETVIDLNYSDDSPGREYAAHLGCRYISGLAMFKRQAEYQRRFWDASEKDLK